MHITLESDYAVRIVHCLATAGKRMDARSISIETNVTLRFSLKILRKLVSSGIVSSFKGVKGGYELARPIDQISLKDVIETVEGSLAISRCISPDFACSCNRVTCTSKKVYEEISNMVSEKLASVKFSDLIK